MRFMTAWFIVWADGTEWYGNCREWAFGSKLRNGTTIRAVRVLRMPGRCNYCGKTH